MLLQSISWGKAVTPVLMGVLLTLNFFMIPEKLWPPLSTTLARNSLCSYTQVKKRSKISNKVSFFLNGKCVTQVFRPRKTEAIWVKSEQEEVHLHIYYQVASAISPNFAHLATNIQVFLGYFLPIKGTKIGDFRYKKCPISKRGFYYYYSIRFKPIFRFFLDISCP